MERGFDEVAIELGDEVVFVRTRRLEVGDAEVALYDDEETRSVSEAEVAFFFVDTSLDAGETEKLPI